MADVFPVDYTTDVGRVRKYIPDLTQYADPRDPSSPAEFYWSDEAIQSFIDDEQMFASVIEVESPAYIFRAAAAAVTSMAHNESMVSKKIVTEDLETDGPAVTKALLTGAASLLRRAAALDEEYGVFETFIAVDYVPDPPRYDWR